MTPTIVSGSEIVVGATSAAKLAPNDIALFALGTRLFAHRFVGRRDDKDGRSALEFCGDAAAQSDPLVDAGAVIAIVLKIEPPMSRSSRHRWAVSDKGWAVDALTSSIARAGHWVVSQASASVARRT